MIGFLQVWFIDYLSATYDQEEETNGLLENPNAASLRPDIFWKG